MGNYENHNVLRPLGYSSHMLYGELLALKLLEDKSVR